jgi:RNA polymerase sigma factor (sigma-70 family)
MMVRVDVGAEYRRWGPELAHYASVLVGHDDAMDVVHEAVVGSLSSGRLDRVDDLRAYWIRSVTNRAASWHRSNGRRARREVRVARWPTADVHADTITSERTGALEALSALTVQQRAVIYLTYWSDLDPARVAQLLGVSDGTVRKQLARGRELLRKELGDGPR